MVIGHLMEAPDLAILGGQLPEIRTTLRLAAAAPKVLRSGNRQKVTISVWRRFRDRA